MGGVFGIWNWMKGNKKCPNCGSYDTHVWHENVVLQKQLWKTDFAFPRNEHGVRPQSLFNETYIHVYSKCNDCTHMFVSTDFKTQRA